MVLGIGYAIHWRDSRRKQLERTNTIASLPEKYHSPLSSTDEKLLLLPSSQLVQRIHEGSISPASVLTAFTKRALQAHEKTNCLTEILVKRAEEKSIPQLEKRLVRERQKDDEGRKRKKRLPLAGVPVSMKDTVCVDGWDSCIGYSKWIGRRSWRDSPMVRLLDDAGAVPFVKTNVPITLLSFESTNPVFGRTKNPHNPKYSPGGSTGGEAALLAFGGSRCGIGTDVAGSVRIPAHYSGIYTIRCSSGRFLKAGNVTSMPGQEGVLAVYSPMCKTLGDLSFFFKGIFDMCPWKYDHTVLPIPWRRVDGKWELVHTSHRSEEGQKERRKVKWGVMWDDGVVPPSPACRRALEEVVSALRTRGDDVVTITGPENAKPYDLLRIASQLLNSDGGKTFLSHFTSSIEWNDTGVVQLVRYFRLPWVFKRIHAWFVHYIRRDPLRAGLLRDWNEKSVPEQWKLVTERERCREEWFSYWNKEDLDFVLSVPHALPAIPENGSSDTVSACGYTFMWNLLDYAAGVMPITKVDRVMDALPEGFKRKELNGIASSAYKLYDPVAMHGLPVGVQVVGRRLEEEKVLAGMERIEEALGREWDDILMD